MKKDWSASLAKIAADGRVGTVLHVGAGAGLIATAALESGAEAVVLVEADPIHVQALNAIAARDARVHVLPTAVGSTSGEGEYYKTNVSHACGLREPTAMRDLFPGLKVVGRSRVRITTPADLLESVPLPEGGRHVLLIESPGEEATLLDGFRAADALCSFSHVLVSAAAQAILPGAEPVENLRSSLMAAGFVTASQDDSDPDFPCLHMTIHPVVREKLGLSKALEESRLQLQARDDQLSQLRAATAEAQARIAALEAEAKALAEARAHAEASARSSAAELAKTIAARDELVTERDGARGERDAARTAAATAEALVATLEEQAKALAEARAHAEASARSSAAELAKTIAARDELVTERDGARGERDAARTAAATAEALVATLEEQAKAAAANRAKDAEKLKSLEQKIKEQEFRLAIAREEFHRAEGQISLLRDLLLQEASL